MSDYQQKVSGSFNERMRLIRLRRKKENLRFWEEFRIIPKGLIWTVVALFLVAQIIAFSVNRLECGSLRRTSFRRNCRTTRTGLPGLGRYRYRVSLCMAIFIFLIAYVNRDAKRRGMNSALWTLLVIVLLPAWTFVGFLIYFLMREPLPYDCPQCGKPVGARFNFCPNCKCNLHPSCPNCKREVVETDKFCPYCAQDLGTPAPSSPEVPDVSGSAG